MAVVPTPESTEVRGEAVAAVRGNPSLVRVLLASGGFNVAEIATWLALLVYAYDLGGARFAGTVAVVQLVPAAVVAPLASVAGDLADRGRLLRWGYLAQAAATAATAVALSAAAPPVVVVALAVVASVTLTVTRPLQGALFPDVSRSPAELVAANSVGGLIVGASVVVAPLAAAGLMALGGPAVVFWTMAAVLGGGATVVAGVVVPVMPRDVVGVRPMLVDARRGWVEIARNPAARTLLVLAGLTMVASGALDLLIVAIAVDVLGLGDAGVGYLNAALGVGMVLGSVATLSLVGRRRLGAALVVGLLLWGAGAVVVGLIPALVVVVTALAVVGAAEAFLDVTGQVLLQRVVDHGTMARAFGLLEGLRLTGLALGAAVGAVLAARVGIGGAVVVVGATLACAALLALRWLDRVDARAVAGLARVGMLDDIPLFADLTVRARDAIAGALVDVAFADGDTLMREGDDGDHLFLLVEGSVSVAKAGSEVARLGPGDVVGEIAVLRAVPRTATVTALGPVSARRLARAEFLTAVTSNPAVAARFHSETDRRLDELGGH